MVQSPIAYRLSGIENKLDQLLTFKEDDPVDNKMVVITCERNGVVMTLNEYIKSVEKDIGTAFHDINRMDNEIGEIKAKLKMEVTT